MNSDFLTLMKERVSKRQSVTLPEKKIDAVVPPDFEQWDYKSKVGPQGQGLPEGAVSWTPRGDPYFGKGVAGTFKKYWYNITGAPSQKTTKEDWDELAPMVERGNQIMREKNEAWWNGDTKRVEQLEGEAKDINWNVLTKTFTNIAGLTDIFEKDKSGEDKKYGVSSPITPFLRLTKVGVMAVADLFQEAAIKLKQGLGAQVAMQEFAAEKGVGDLFAAENIPLPLSDEARLGADALVKLLPPVTVYNLIRFAAAPGTFDEKINAVEKGWDAGRVLYSGVHDSAIREEFIRRAENGEDPQLLAMELENPWAEMAGEMLLDPLNLIGFFSKAAKVAKIVDREAEVIASGGRLADEFSDALKGAVASDVKASQKITSLVEMRRKSVQSIQEGRLTQRYTPGAFTTTGNIQRTRRNMESFIHVALSSTIRSGGSVEDLADTMRYGVLSVSDNADEMIEGITGLLNSTGTRAFFSDQATETFMLMRNVLKDQEGVLDAGKIIQKINGTNGDLAETAKLINSLTEKATHYQFPTFTEMRNAAVSLEKAQAAGKTVVARTQELANAYNNYREGAKRTLQWAEKAVTGKNWVNRVLGSFYFNQYGYAVRNIENNFLTTLVDTGSKAYFQDGKYWSQASIDDYLRGWFAGELPVEASGFETAIDAMAGGKLSKYGLPESVTKVLPQTIASKAEEGMAKRVFWARFKETIDQMFQPGRLLPKMDEFKAAGFSEDQVRHFVSVLKQNHGDVNKTIGQVFSGKKDAWRMYELYFDEKTMKGFGEQGILDELKELISNEKATPEDISKWWDARISEAQKRASLASNNIPQLDSRAQEIANSFGKAEEDGLLQGASKIPVVLNQSFKASDEYMSALWDAYSKAPPTPQMTQRFGDFFKTATSKVRENMVREKTIGQTEAAWGVTREIRNGGMDFEYYWKKAGIQKPFPADISGEDLLSEIWKHTKDDVSAQWDAYFDDLYVKSEQLAQELTETIRAIDEPLADSLSKSFTEARRSTMKANIYRTAEYSGNKITVNAPETFASIAKEFGANPQQVKAGFNKYDPETWAKITSEGREPTNAEVRAMFEKRKAVKEELGPIAKRQEAAKLKSRQAELNHKNETGTITPAEKEELQGIMEELAPMAEKIELAPPLVTNGGPPISTTHMWNEVAPGTIEAMKRAKSQMLSRYGTIHPDDFNAGKAQQFSNLAKDLQNRVSEAQFIATRVGKEWRDFAMLPYGEQRNLDLMASFVFPYQFWYSRTYANWGRRLATDPQVVANYFRLKEVMSGIHKDSPEWFRYNVQIPDFLGINQGNPMIMNMEANLWPLYGLTGVDFNDPYKRVDMLTATVDDMGKFGPSVWAPIQMAIAAGLSMQGEKDAAARTAGRLVPQTGVIKSISAYFGKPVELDPNVNLFSGGIDPYERNRVGRALAAMVQDDPELEEQAIEAARTQSGSLWEEAYRRAVLLRAPGQISSFLLGTGFKARTPQDIEIEKFYQDYAYINNQSKADLISPEQYRASLDGLREKYPFMDTVLLAKRGGEERNRAYIYNVLGRIPPGEMTELLEVFGVDSDLISKFYDSKGDTSTWKEGDRLVLQSAAVNIGATLEMPSGASREEWGIARNQYNQMRTVIETQYGEEIWKKTDAFFDLLDQDPQMADAFLLSNPDVQEALDLKDEFVVNNPILNMYYGGFDTVQRYYNGTERKRMIDKYGPTIYQDYYRYLNLLDKREKQRSKREHPNLDPFMDEKGQAQEQVNRSIIQLYLTLPARPQVQAQGDLSGVQERLVGILNQPDIDPEKIAYQMTPELIDIVYNNYVNGEKIPYSATQQLEYIASQNDMSKNELLQILGIGLSQ